MTSKDGFGHTCHIGRPPARSARKPAGDMPLLNAQFFYSSPLPIDDPLSAIPPPSGSETSSAKDPPRPFSTYDNNVLEDTWLSLASEKDRKLHEEGRAVGHLSKAQTERRTMVVAELAMRHNRIHAAEGGATTVAAELAARLASEQVNKASKEQGIKGVSQHPQAEVSDDRKQAMSCCAELETEVRLEHNKGHTSRRPKRRDTRAEQDQLIRDVLKEAETQKRTLIHNAAHDQQACRKHSEESLAAMTQEDDLPHAESDAGSLNYGAQGHHAPDRQNQTPTSSRDNYPEASSQQQLKSLHDVVASPGSDSPYGSSPAAHSTTGHPFLRVPSRTGKAKAVSRFPTSPFDDNSDNDTYAKQHARTYGTGRQLNSTTVMDDNVAGGSPSSSACRAHQTSTKSVEVPVGVSRLHLVKLPSLQMMPIYWSPVHDVATVTRGTWFYNDTMCPVEPAVANQLESGFRELRPWSKTWNDELNSAAEVGAAGEEKVVHKLWPNEDEYKRGGTDGNASQIVSNDPICAARCFNGEAAAAGTIDHTTTISENESSTVAPTSTIKRFINCLVLYKNGEHAFILKPSLAPSAYFGRKPLSKIRKGTTVGIHVVRGFDRKAFEKLHPSGKTTSAVRGEAAAAVAGSAGAKEVTCPACREIAKRPKVSDLVFVIHGIGQKLSERVESFHFTHAVNSFRRAVNVELGNESVQNVLRKDLGGVMVLPINWRSNLSFDEGAQPNEGDSKTAFIKDGFSLKDITPKTIPAVRNLISDVMLDIPFYMSHHKGKMIAALAREANRVYRLWCANNPDFHENGSVHILAHSLGTAMALEVLSKQPTFVKHPLLDLSKTPEDHFIFDTKNLFFVGSPAGFFLLLERANLVPRKGRHKVGAEPHDNTGKGMTGEANTFGCLAVDNIYNIMHYNDPIAYRLNPAVDASYAASLKNAQVPSATTGFFESIGNAVRSLTPGVSTAPELGVGQVAKPIVTRLPSQLEMEVHDFTREEIAENKFSLLNDNGQIDWFLSTGGGPLEIQYLNMLGAHSSYWTHPDFVRLLVTEVGRKRGKEGVLPNMRAIKTTHR